VRILVKAFPQHSDKYQETVCCAGVTDDAQLIRLYPITYRRLAQENQFNRYDLIEATLTKASNDGRPESYRVDHDSIKVIEHSTGLSHAGKVRLWQPHILPSLTALEEEHRANGRSLGIIQPDPASLKFSWRDAEPEDKEDTRSVQASLFEQPLRPLEPPEFTFFYRHSVPPRLGSAGYLSRLPASVRRRLKVWRKECVQQLIIEMEGEAYLTDHDQPGNIRNEASGNKIS
jgi:hypothetical protein